MSCVTEALGLSLPGCATALAVSAKKDRIAQESGETVQIHVPEDGSLIVLDVATPPAPFFLQIVPGTRLEYHASAFGKAFLAFQPEERVARLVKLAARSPGQFFVRHNRRFEPGFVHVTEILAGFVRPTEGEVWLAGERVDEVPPARRNAKQPHPRGPR